MKGFENSKLKYILIFSTWFSIGMTALKWYSNYEDSSSASFSGSLVFTFLFWLVCGGVFGYLLWLKKFKEPK
jgi:hypothetical protein